MHGPRFFSFHFLSFSNSFPKLTIFTILRFCLLFSAMRTRKRHLFCTSSHHNVPFGNKSSTRGLNLEMSVLARAPAQLLKMLYISTRLSVPHGENV